MTIISYIRCSKTAKLKAISIPKPENIRQFQENMGGMQIVLNSGILPLKELRMFTSVKSISGKSILPVKLNRWGKSWWCNEPITVLFTFLQVEAGAEGRRPQSGAKPQQDRPTQSFNRSSPKVSAPLKSLNSTGHNSHPNLKPQLQETRLNRPLQLPLKILSRSDH